MKSSTLLAVVSFTAGCLAYGWLDSWKRTLSVDSETIQNESRRSVAASSPLPTKDISAASKPASNELAEPEARTETQIEPPTPTEITGMTEEGLPVWCLSTNDPVLDPTDWTCTYRNACFSCASGVVIPPQREGEPPTCQDGSQPLSQLAQCCAGPDRPSQACPNFKSCLEQNQDLSTCNEGAKP